jgi:hypothetical protein
MTAADDTSASAATPASPPDDATQPAGPGATGGLPGDNADPRASELRDDELDDTVAGTGLVAGESPAEAGSTPAGAGGGSPAASGDTGPTG